jgi:hypothetical protein
MAADQDVLNVRLPKDLSAAIKRAAELDERSVNGQVIVYLRRCLITDGHYQSVRPVVTAEPTPTPLSKAAAEPLPVAQVVQRAPVATPKLPRPSTRQETPSGVRVAAIIAAIGVEVRAEQNRPLGKNQIFLRQLIESTFPYVTDLSSARAIGLDAWIDAGARPGLIAVLFPGDRSALGEAKRQQNRVQIDRQMAAGDEVKRFSHAKGLYGRGAVVFRDILAQHFPGMRVEDAVAKGPDAWLTAGVSEDTARRLFGDDVGDEAKRRTQARSNAKKKRAGAA